MTTLITKLTAGLFRNNKIRKKLILYFMVTTSLMAATSFYTYFNARILTKQVDTLFASNISLNILQDEVTNIHQNLESYLDTKHSDSIVNFQGNKNKIQKFSRDILSDPDYSANGLLFKDIANMLNNYLNLADHAIQSKRARDIYNYTNYYNGANQIFGYINSCINKLNNELLRENTIKYHKTTKKIDIIQMVNIIIICAVVLFNLIFMLLMTYKTTKPLIKLSQAAEEISRGNYTVPEVSVNTDDEISVMASAFNKMVSSIKEHIDDLEEKALLQNKLREQELQNLIMKNHLKEAELQALQSQINPHFIFNTLNTGAQIAMMEGADKTCYFIENVANLFRYNIKKLDKPVSLCDEIKNIETYVFILKTRFTDRITFNREIKTNNLDINMPCMILQPIVENAFIHGIGDLESGGTITLSVEEFDNYIEVTISDNGKGMPQSKIEQLLSKDSTLSEKTNADSESKKGHTTGIGMGNVISRLNLFFCKDDIVSIYSQPQSGTLVSIKIPIPSKESLYV